VHPDLSDKAIGMIEKRLALMSGKALSEDLRQVGMAGIATNKGVLVHPKTTNNEIAVLEELFKLPVDIGTVNFGSHLVGSGILANSKGYVAVKIPQDLRSQGSRTRWGMSEYQIDI